MRILYPIFALCTGMVSYEIHADEMKALFAFLLAPIAWGYWLVTKQVNLTIIQHTFEFFFK